MTSFTNKIFIYISFVIIVIVSLWNTNYHSADMVTYARLFDHAQNIDGEYFYFKYDPIFFWLMRVLGNFDINFQKFHVMYIFIFTFLWLVSLANYRIKMSVRNIFIQALFMCSIYFSPYVNESFRIYPIVLMSGFFLHYISGKQKNLPKKAFSLLSQLFYILLHWSFIFVAFWRSWRIGTGSKSKYLLGFGILLFAILLFWGKAGAIFTNYIELQSRYELETQKYNIAAMIKVVVIWFLMRSYRVKPILNLIFIVCLCILINVVSNFSYTAVARLTDLFFHAYLLSMLLSSNSEANIKLRLNNQVQRFV